MVELRQRKVRKVYNIDPYSELQDPDFGLPSSIPSPAEKLGAAPNEKTAQVEPSEGSIEPAVKKRRKTTPGSATVQTISNYFKPIQTATSCASVASLENSSNSASDKLSLPCSQSDPATSTNGNAREGHSLSPAKEQSREKCSPSKCSQDNNGEAFHSASLSYSSDNVNAPRSAPNDQLLKFGAPDASSDSDFKPPDSDKDVQSSDVSEGVPSEAEAEEAEDLHSSTSEYEVARQRRKSTCARSSSPSGAQNQRGCRKASLKPTKAQHLTKKGARVAWNREIPIHFEESIRSVQTNEATNLFEPFDVKAIQVLPAHLAARDKLLTIIAEQIRLSNHANPSTAAPCDGAQHPLPLEASSLGPPAHSSKNERKQPKAEKKMRNLNLPTTAFDVSVRENGQIECPIGNCPYSGANRSAWVNHTRNAPHSLVDFLLHTFPQTNSMGGDDAVCTRSELLGSLPDDHRLNNLRADVLELVFLVPLPLYPLEVKVGGMRVRQVEKNYDHSLKFSPPPFDVYAYTQLKQVYTSSTRPELHHIKYLILHAIQAEYRKYHGTPIDWNSENVSDAAQSSASKLDVPILSHANVLQLEQDGKKRSERSTKASRQSNASHSNHRDADLMPHLIAGPRMEEIRREPHAENESQCAALLCEQYVRTNYTEKYEHVGFDTVSSMLPQSTVEVQFECDGVLKASVTLARLESTYFRTSRHGYTLNTGGMVMALSWMGPYLAVAGYLSTEEHHVVGRKAGGNGVILIWEIPTLPDEKARKNMFKRREKGKREKPKEKDASIGVATAEAAEEPESAGSIEREQEIPRLAMILVHDWGVSFDLKWWPILQYDRQSSRLGILAGCFGDGSLRVLDVPQPRPNCSEPICLRVLQPVFTAVNESTSLYRVSWGGREHVAVGCTNGWMMIYHVPTSFKNAMGELTVAFPAHDSFVRDVCFESGAHLPKPNRLVSSGADGRLIMWDLRDQFSPLVMYRSRNFLMCVAWPSFMNSVIYGDSDHTARIIRIADCRTTLMMYGHGNTMWSIATSPFHPFMVSTSSDGRAVMTNINRLRGSGVRPITLSLYQVKLKTDSQNSADQRPIYVMSDNLAYEQPTNAAMKRDICAVLKFDPQAALHAVRLHILEFATNQIIQAAWSTSEVTAGWIATGGRSGLVRIENVARASRT